MLQYYHIYWCMRYSCIDPGAQHMHSSQYWMYTQYAYMLIDNTCTYTCTHACKLYVHMYTQAHTHPHVCTHAQFAYICINPHSYIRMNASENQHAIIYLFIYLYKLHFMFSIYPSMNVRSCNIDCT